MYDSAQQAYALEIIKRKPLGIQNFAGCGCHWTPVERPLTCSTPPPLNEKLIKFVPDTPLS